VGSSSDGLFPRASRDCQPDRQAERKPLRAIVLTVARISVLATGFFIAVLAGGLALLAALAGVLCAKWIMLRKDAGDPDMNSPLDSTVLFQIGPIPITQAIVTTWAIMAMLVIGAFLLTRRLDLRPTRRQAALELMVATLDTQITETTGAAPAPIAGSSARSLCSSSWRTGPRWCRGSSLRPHSLKPMPPSPFWCSCR
jgi:hypothetical protein